MEHWIEAGKPALLGIPWDENSSFQRGAAAAPPLIRAALLSGSSNLWTEDGIDLGAARQFIDAGDLPSAAGEEMFRSIEETVLAVLDRRLRPIVLGGDHSITYPVVRAVARKHGHLTILDFDAHPDLYPEYQGNLRSHACPFARIMEEGLVRRLVQVGIRTMNRLQRRQADSYHVEVIEMKDWRGILPPLDSPVYISFDLDALDPAFAPGVSHREPGGLSVREALTAIQAVNADVVGADIVEFNPLQDPLNTTAAVCAKIFKEIAALMLANG